MLRSGGRMRRCEKGKRGEGEEGEGRRGNRKKGTVIENEENGNTE